MAERVFSTQYPGTCTPKLPEYFQKATLEGVIPGQAVFPFAGIINYDEVTKLLYVDTKSELDEEATDPEYFGPRLGLLRVYTPIEGEFLDGFVADFRHVPPGSIDGEMIHSSTETSSDDCGITVETASDEEDRIKRLEARGTQPLLAAVFTDPDGSPHFMGDKRVIDHITALMDLVDERVAADTEETEEPTDTTDDAASQPDETSYTPIELAGYYLG